MAIPTIRRRAAWLLLALACAACGGSDRPKEAAVAARANVVFVLSDALRASSLELYGYPRETAPNLTALAAESLVFEDHMVSYPATPVSVSQMLTGRFRSPDLMRATYLHAPVRAIGGDLLVLPRELRAAGYRTGIVTSHPWWTDAPALEWFDHQALLEPPGERPYAPIEAFSEPVREFLDGARNRPGGEPEPFFLYVHSLDTHSPLFPHEGLTPPPSEAFPRIYDHYDGEIRYTDRWLGWLIGELERRGLLDDTLFVLTSDHGEELGEMGPGAWNWSHGFTLRRAQLHVPLVMRLPGGRVAGRVAETTRHLDLAPTLYELLLGSTGGGKAAALDRFRRDGRSLAARIGPDGWRPPEPDAPPVSTPAFNERYRSLHRGDLALHHDLWTGRYEAWRAVPDARNYPEDRPAAEAELPAGFRRELDRFHRRTLREYHALPPAPVPASPMIVGVPGPVPGTAAGAVTYEADPEDGLWTLSPFHYLTAGAGEVPPPIELAMPWIPGSYRVAVRLARPPEGRVALAPFRVEILGTDAPPMEVEVEVDPAALEGADTDERDGVYAELGTYEIGRFFRTRITAPEGRVVIRGFRFTPLDAAGRPAEVDPDLEDRLRALGYVR